MHASTTAVATQRVHHPYAQEKDEHERNLRATELSLTIDGILGAYRFRGRMQEPFTSTTETHSLPPPSSPYWIALQRMPACNFLCVCVCVESPMTLKTVACDDSGRLCGNRIEQTNKITKKDKKQNTLRGKHSRQYKWPRRVLLSCSHGCTFIFLYCYCILSTVADFLSWGLWDLETF